MKIYLAGKIAKNDWRHGVVADLRGEGWVTGHEVNNYRQIPIPGLVLAKAIYGKHDYTGPYFASCDHGCGHGSNSHGVNVGGGGCITPPRSADVVNMCLRGIQECDMVYAWIDSPDAYGTLAEIGFAVSEGKKVYVAGSQRFTDLWFAYELAQQSGGGFVGVYPTAESGLAVALAYARGDDAIDVIKLSPIEARFYESWQAVANGYGRKLVPQYELFGGKYRLDFAEPESKIGIELDGYDYHSSKEAFTKDRKRQREIEAAGWRVIRFSGSEVYRDAAGCASEALAFITGQTTTDAGRLPY